MTRGLEAFLNIAPAQWPGCDPTGPQPGDPNTFVPMGPFGVSLPMLVMPWGQPPSQTGRSPYSPQPHSGHPHTGAPISESGGGTLYFDRFAKQEDFQAALRLMRLQDNDTDYAAFVHEAVEPAKDRYVTQLRIISGFALDHAFNLPKSQAGNALRKQSLTIGEALWRFVEHFVNEARAGRYRLNGLLGGDGDWAYEKLAFGLMVENSYYSVLRIWTRAWLVTK